MLSGAGAFGSGFIPGGNVSKSLVLNLGITLVDGAIDIKANGITNFVGHGKNYKEFGSDLFFGTVNVATGGAVQKSGASNAIQNTRNFVIGGTSQYMNGKVND